MNEINHLKQADNVNNLDTILITNEVNNLDTQY